MYLLGLWSPCWLLAFMKVLSTSKNDERLSFAKEKACIQCRAGKSDV